MATRINHSSSYGCGFFIILIVAGLFFLFMNQVSTPHQVTLRASGNTSMVLVTYTNSQGVTEQQNGVSPPWSKTFAAKSGDVIVLAVTNSGGDGSVTAEILIDGKTVKTSTSSGTTVSAVSGTTVP